MCLLAQHILMREILAIFSAEFTKTLTTRSVPRKCIVAIRSRDELPIPCRKVIIYGYTDTIIEIMTYSALVVFNAKFGYKFIQHDIGLLLYMLVSRSTCSDCDYLVQKLSDCNTVDRDCKIFVC